MTTTLPHQQTHNKAGTIDGKRNRRDKDYYHDVTVALEPAMEWLILGPSSARIELEEHVLPGTFDEPRSWARPRTNALVSYGTA